MLRLHGTDATAGVRIIAYVSLLSLTLWFFTGCTMPQRTSGPGPTPTESVKREPPSRVLGQNDEFAVIIATESDSARSLAAHYYGDQSKYWRIVDANTKSKIQAGDEVIIPLADDNVTGVYRDGYKSVAILAYHGFGNSKGRLTVSRKSFDAQMRYLSDNHYRVISLQHFIDFIHAKRSIPQRAIVITIDDGYRSTFDIAFPTLVKFGFPATVFPYSDFIGNGGLSWAQLREMEASGLIDVQLHSQTHDNLTIQREEESVLEFKRRLEQEVQAPKQLFANNQLRSKPRAFAYPYGAANELILEELRKADIDIAFTVNRGSNPFFSFPYTIKRSQVYRDDSIKVFAKKLRTFERLKPL